MMQVLIETTPTNQLAYDAVAIIEFETAEGATPPDTKAAIAHPGWMDDLRSSGEFTGKLYDFALQYNPPGMSAKKLIAIGGGKREKFTDVQARRVAGVLVRTAKGKNIRSVALSLDGMPQHVEAAIEGAIVGAWEAHKYKSDPKKNDRQVDVFAVSVPDGDRASLENAVERGQIIAEGQNLARDLVNEPANKLTPVELANAARKMCEAHGLKIEVLDQDAMTELGMGALLGVAQGSSNPPYLIAMKYRPSMTQARDHLALVGKGVTFDTGGISIKPSDGMEKMKYDMAGAAAVIGAMSAIAQLKPSISVTGYVPTVENMLNGNAQRPGDIVTALSGKTIEVLNTDAEGRLILADAITYANRNGATHMVDAATLTGAISIALGHYYVGAFTNNQEFLGKLLSAANQAGEKTWELPLDEDYKEYLKSAFADLPNIGGRYGGSITAAWFLREFADPTPWVHLDIAGTAWLDDGKAWLSKGPSGVAVRTFVELATNWNASS